MISYLTRLSSSAVFSTACFLVSLPASSASAKTPEARLAPPTAAIGARVGAAVSAEKDLIVIGAPDDDEAGPFAGAVYVYARHGNDWVLQAKLLGPHTSGFRAFGEAVAVSGSTLVVGAPFDGLMGEASGAVYVYSRKGKTWSLQATLKPTDSTAFQQFGDAVAIDGSTIVVGAFADSSSLLNAGAAYIFSKSGSTWTQRAKLTASDASEFAFFGTAVAIHDDTVLVGSPTVEQAYVFSSKKDAWTQQAILTAPDALEGDYSAFGASVALDRATIVIGAPTEGLKAPNSGAAYTFVNKGNKWVVDQKLSPSNGAGGDEFGTAVSVEGHTVAVGAPYHGSAQDGAVFVFTGNPGKWSQQSMLTGKPATAYLGSSVALVGETLVSGAPAYVDFHGLQSAGAAYVFRVP